MSQDLSWDVPCGILRTPIHTNLQGMQDYPAISFVGYSRHQVTPIFREAQDYPGMSLVGSSGDQLTSGYGDVPGLSWDVPCGILRTPIHTNLQGCTGMS